MGAARFEKGVSEGHKPARDAFAGGGSLWVYVNQGENCRWRRRWDSNLLGLSSHIILIYGLYMLKRVW